jgi:hypothetical protein
MAYFAKISEENKVLSVVALDNINTQNSEGVEVESIGQAYLQKHNNWPSHLWIKTSYNTFENVHKLGGQPFRGNFAGIGYTWDSENQIFWKPKPYPSWTKDISTASWVSPAGVLPSMPQEKIDQTIAQTHSWEYDWNENTQSWDLINLLA